MSDYIAINTYNETFMANQNLDLCLDQGHKTCSVLTPRDIVKKQIANFHYHVTEEDFDKMILTDYISSRQRTALQQSDTLSKQGMNTSYEVLGNP